MSETYEIEVLWQAGRSEYSPLGLKVVNYKFLCGMWIDQIFPQIIDGEINCFKYKVYEDEWVWSSYERFRPSDFSFKTAVSFNRYT